MVAANSEVHRSGSGLHRLWAALLITAAVFAAFTIPIVGLLIAVVGLPLLAMALQRSLWPRSSSKSNVIHACLVGLWIPAFALGEYVFGRADSAWGAMVWLVVPLCEPSGPAALVVPALVAASCSLLGLLGSVAMGRPVLWLVGTFLSPVAYELAFQQLGASYFC